MKQKEYKEYWTIQKMWYNDVRVVHSGISPSESPEARNCEMMGVKVVFIY